MCAEEVLAPTEEQSPTFRIVEWRRDDNPEVPPISLSMPSLGQLLNSSFPTRRYLLAPWLREQESVMVYAPTGVGKSFFSLSCALAVAGGGRFFGWTPDRKDGGYRVLYVDGEMHIADIQARARLLLRAVGNLDEVVVRANLHFLPRHYQKPGLPFPLITEESGARLIMDLVHGDRVDLVVLDNFSTLGQVEDENAASCFDSIQDTLLALKASKVATLLVHHANKTGQHFRGSSKLGATFETIVQLEPPSLGHCDPETDGARFVVRWEKVRSGGRSPRPIVGRLKGGDDLDEVPAWDFEERDLTRLDEIKRLLKDEAFAFRREIGDYFGVSKTMATKYIRRGAEVGLWTERWVDEQVRRGTLLRNRGKTRAPVPLPEPEGPPNEDFSETATAVVTDPF